MFTTFILPLLLSLAAAQQNVLVDGNSQLPQCAQQCPLLQQANSACVATGSPQAAWTCFCQSAYLTPLYTTAVGVCDSVCTDATQNAQVSTWYKSNCGTDFGVSEHAAETPSAAAAAATTTTATAAAPAAPAPTTSSSNNAGSNGGSSSANSGSNTGTNPSASSTGADWWSGHYQWIIMVIVMAIGFSLLAWLLVWLKRRHDRKQDMVTGGFNAGITERSTPMGGNEEKNASSTLVPVVGSGRNSPARTREAFMPYGYGYARSESRLASSQAVDRPTSPLAAEAMSGGLGPWPAESSSQGLSRGG